LKLSQKKYKYASTITHQGNVFAFSAQQDDDDPAKYRIGYSILDLDLARTETDAWKDFKLLEFPKQLRPVGVNLITVDFKKDPTPVADVPFFVMSDTRYVCVFRQSSANTLLVDRFVFDSTLAVLTNAWEVRYRRSRKIDTPADRKDTFGSTDMEGKRFIEPTTELTMIGNLSQGRFAALVLPAEVPNPERWLIAAFNASSGTLDTYSIAVSDIGLFDLTDAIDPDTHTVLPDSKLVLKSGGAALAYQSAPAALLYTKQERLQDEYGRMHLLKKEARVMVAVAAGPNKQIAIADFGLGKDGRIAQIGNELPIAAYPAIGNALAFDRPQLTAASLPAFGGTAAAELSVELWINPNEFGDGDEFVIAANPDQKVNQVQPFSLLLSAGVPHFTVTANGVAKTVAGETLDPKFWYHLAGTWNGTDLTLYINGQPYRTAGQPPASPPAVTGGYLLGGATGFTGSLKELRLWNISLDRAQILKRMNQPVAPDDPNWSRLLGYWHLDRPPGAEWLTTILNSSAAGAAGNGTLSGADWTPANAPVGASMSPVLWDSNGLSATSALLTFAATDQTPSLLESADGLVHLYFRDLTGGAILAAQYNTTTARAQYRSRWIAADPQTPSNTEDGTYRFLARQPGILMNNPLVTPPYVGVATDALDNTKCTVTLMHYTGLTETWPKVPRDIDQFLQVINGDAIQTTTDPVAVARGVLMYDYTAVVVKPGTGYPGIKPGPGTGSGVFSVISDTLPDNGMTGLVQPTDTPENQPVLARAGMDCWWVAVPPIATLTLAGDGDSIGVFNATQIAAYKGQLNLSANRTIEAWVNPSAIPIQDPDVRILVYNNPGQKATYTLGIDDLGRPFAGTQDMAAVAASYQIGLNRWTHLAATYTTDYGIRLSGTKYMDAGDDESLKSTEAVTIEGWVKLDQTGRQQTIASKWSKESGGSWKLYVGSDNVPAFDVEQLTGTRTSLSQARAPQALQAGTWYHVAGIYDVAYKKEGAIQFQAVDRGYVTIPQLNSPPADAVTVSAWIYLLGFVSGSQIIIHTADAEQAVIFTLLMNNRVPTFSVDTNTKHGSITAQAALPIETWIHIAGTFDSDGAIAMYIDGLPAAPPTGLSSVSPAGAVAIAADAAAPKAVYSVGGFATHQPFDGWINELCIWNRALSIDEVRRYMKVSLSGGERGLVGYWPFQDRFGTTAMDLAGTSNGTLVNATYVQVQKGAFTHKVLINARSHAGARVEAAVNATDSHLLFGATDGAEFLQATVDSLRLWKVGRMDWEVLYYMSTDVPSSSEGLLGNWTFETGHGRVGFDSKANNNAVFMDAKLELTDEIADSMWIPTTFKAGWILYVNGAAVPSEPYTPPAGFGQPQFGFGGMVVGSAVGKFYRGSLNEIRIWNLVRTAVQIRENQYRPLSGAELGLVGYWPVSAGSGEIVGDATGAGANGLWQGIDDAPWTPSLVPLGNEGPAVRAIIGGAVTPAQLTTLSGPTAAEYGAVLEAADGQLLAVMDRAYIFVDPQQALNLIPGFAVGDLDLQFVSQVQTRPTLLGYIEGAPPVPSENLMLGSDSPTAYMGTSSATLTFADEATQIYTASRDTGFDMSVDARLGAQFESRTEAGLVVSTLLFGFISKVGVHTNFEHTLGWLNDATFTTSLSTTKSNTVKNNGAWQKNTYKIDGEKGFLYFPNNQGYALVNSGTADLYALRLRDTGALVSYTMVPNPDIPADVNIIPFAIAPKYVKNGTLDAYIGFEHEKSYSELSPGERGSYFKPLQAYAIKQQIDRELQQLMAVYDEFQAASIGRRSNVTQFTEGDIGSASTDLGNVVMGLKGDKQYSAEEWKAALARRNLVNTYVWTAEGGFYAEEEQFSAVRDTSVGGSYDFKGTAGIYTEMGMSTGIHFELDALFGGHIRTRAVKTSREGTTFGLKVDVNGERFICGTEIEQQTKPVPGKVRGYRFMSIYLAPNKRNFDEFPGIVDQDWLNGQGPYAGSYDPDAFALRQALTRGNEVWRVLHRVTYVNRVPDDSHHDEGESIGKDVLKPSPESVATNAWLLAQLPKTADRIGPVSVILDALLASLEANPLWGALLASEESEVKSGMILYLRGYYGV